MIDDETPTCDGCGMTDDELQVDLGGRCRYCPACSERRMRHNSEAVSIDLRRDRCGEFVDGLWDCARRATEEALAVIETEAPPALRRHAIAVAAEGARVAVVVADWQANAPSTADRLEVKGWWTVLASAVDEAHDDAVRAIEELAQLGNLASVRESLDAAEYFATLVSDLATREPEESLEAAAIMDRGDALSSAREEVAA